MGLIVPIWKRTGDVHNPGKYRGITLLSQVLKLLERQTRQRAEPAAVHISTGPHKQEDGDEGCHEETPLCRRPGPGGEWQTGATGDTG